MMIQIGMLEWELLCKMQTLVLSEKEKKYFFFFGEVAFFINLLIIYQQLGIFSQGKRKLGTTLSILMILGENKSQKAILWMLE